MDTPDHQEALDELYSYMDSSKDRSGVSTRDDSLSFYSNILGGRLHFLHFETRNMVSGIEMLSSTGITENIRTIGCTGGGAHKYAKEFEEQLGITFVQLDELGCLVRGMNFALTNVVGECYTYRNDATAPTIPIKIKSPNISPKATDQTMMNKEVKNNKDNKDNKDNNKYKKKEKEKETETETEEHTKCEENVKDEGWRRDVKEHTYKVTMPHEMFVTNELFPYLVVNIGSGVSILKVRSPGVFERVSGSSLGGGTYVTYLFFILSCFYIFISLPIFIFLFLYFYFCTFLFLYFFIFMFLSSYTFLILIYLVFHLTVCSPFFIYLSIYLSINSSFHLSFHLSIHLSIYLSIYLSISLSINLFIYLFLCLPIIYLQFFIL